MLRTIDIGKTLPAKRAAIQGAGNRFRYEGTCQRVNSSELRSIAGKALTRLEGCWGMSLSSM